MAAIIATVATAFYKWHLKKREQMHKHTVSRQTGDFKRYLRRWGQPSIKPVEIIFYIMFFICSRHRWHWRGNP